jgi:predicted nucleotidyltransferase component of viral defense system
LPRLSVDIDLLYLPLDDREIALQNIKAALSRLSLLIKQKIPRTKVQLTHLQSDALRLIVSQDEIRIKIELSPVIRGTVFPEVRMEVVEEVEKEFGYAEIQVASLPDLYAGKLCAALDRQHPRDLFDVKFLLENDGLTDNLRKTFLIFLISHQRPMSELLSPNRKNISEIYETEFKQMTEVSIPLVQLEEARENLIHQINSQMTDNEKKFLLSFKSKAPDWNLLEMENINVIANLPSVLWKMINLEKMSVRKHKEAFNKLKSILYQTDKV